MNIPTLSRIAWVALMLSGCLQEVEPLPAPEGASQLPEPARKTVVTSAASEFIPPPSLAKDLAACKAALADMGGRVAALENENTGLSAQIQRLTAEAAKVEDFERRLLVETRTGKSLRDRLTGLEQELADSRVNAQRLTDELQSAQKQISDSQVASQQQLELAEQEISRRKAALAETTRHLDTLDQEKQRIAATLADTTRHLDALNQEKERTAAALADSQRRLDALTATLSAEHSRATGLTQENQRLEQAYAALRQSLEAELADRDLKLRQAQSRVVVTILDHVLFDSGRATLKPAGMKVLDQLSAALKRTEDKEIHVEGHTDNRPIRGPLAKQYATNWELSSARATTVVRYLIEQAGLPATSLSAVGYADTKPVASNDTEQSRAENRRIEILLYPKGLPRSTLALN